MSAHTPGPWKERVGATGDRSIYATDAAICEISKRFATPEIRAANARLIKAGPELLEALKAVCGMRSENSAEALKRARAAIAKAEGL